jgi:Dolichyl-phosphate-mannose-protein mannosyltransferase
MSAALSVPPTITVELKREHRRFLVLLFAIGLAAGHALWAANWLADRFRVGADLYGGFRLLGAPDASLTALLVHVDFCVFLIGACWLTHYRWTYQRPAVIEQDSLDWTSGHRLGLVGVLGLGAGLLLWNLGGPLLWQDEAQSALISRTVLQTGLPRGTDGLNYFSQEYGAEYAENHLWRWHTWLPFYIVAGSYELLGDNTFAARFPGALLGWISIWLTYQAGVELWRDRRSALCGAGVLTICVGFLLLSRQCRYYSASICFTLMSVIGYWRLMRSQRGGYWLLISGMTLLFQTHYVYTGICGAAFVSHCGWFHRERGKPLAIAAAWVVVLSLPWVIWFLQMKYGSRYGGRTFDPQQTGTDFLRYVGMLAVELVPWMLWPIPYLLSRFRRTHGIRTSDQSHTPVMALLGMLIAAHLLMLAPIIPKAFFRYLAPLIPLTALFVGRWIADASRIHQALAGWMVAVLFLGWPCTDFVAEQLRPVHAPGEAILRYLEVHSRPHDVIAANYGDLPLKFYLPNRVIGGLTGEGLAGLQPPEWIVMRRHLCRGLDAVDDQLREWAQNGEYEQITIPVPDSPFEHREVPTVHVFATDWNQPPVVIYRRVTHTVKITSL